jgi:hypothetical protein
MKKIIAALFLNFVVFVSNAQVKLDDFGRIILNTYLPDNIAIPTEAKNLLITKLNQFASNNGMGGSQSNPRFIITAKVNVGTKDIIAGPPQMIAQNLDVTFYIGDAITNTLFVNTTISLKGVGTNENKAFIDALKTINPKNKEVLAFLEEGKTKIINYYSTNCDFIIKDAQTLVKQEKYDEAIFQLSIVPDVCKDCYFKCLDTLTQIYQQKIDADCVVKLNEAKVTWTAAQTPNGAERAGDIFSTINPLANCQTEVDALINTIAAKLKADEKVRWEFKMKQYADKIAAQKEQVIIAVEKSKRDDVYRENQSQRDAVAQEKQSQRNYDLDKIRVSACRDVAVEYAKSQPKTATYNNIYWR